MPSIKFLLAIALFAIFTSLAATSPVEVSKRGEVNGWFDMCMKPHLGGNCQTIGFKSGVCNPIPTRLEDRIRSARPWSGYNANCWVYSNRQCKGDLRPLISWPEGLMDMEARGYHGWTRSWKCDCGDDCKIATNVKVPPAGAENGAPE